LKQFVPQLDQSLGVSVQHFTGRCELHGFRGAIEQVGAKLRAKMAFLDPVTAPSEESAVVESAVAAGTK
jgi:hypothetical protein